MVEYLSLKYHNLAERFTNPGLDDEPPYEAFRWANARKHRNGISDGLRQYLDNRFQDAAFAADKNLRNDLRDEVFGFFDAIQYERKQAENNRCFISNWEEFIASRPHIYETGYVISAKTFLSVMNSFSDWFFKEDIEELHSRIDESSKYVEFISRKEKDLRYPLRLMRDNGTETAKRRRYVIELLFYQITTMQPQNKGLDWLRGKRAQLRDDYIVALSQSLGLSMGQGRGAKKKVAEPMESQFLGETITRYWSLHLGIN